MIRILLVLISLVFSSQYQFAQNNLSKLIYPDTLIIELYDTYGCEENDNTFISIRYSNGAGLIYTYNIRNYNNYDNKNYHHLKRGYFDRNTIDSITKLIVEYKIDSIENNQINPNITRMSTADGEGKCYLYLSNGKNKFSKTISYPKPLGERTIDNLFKDFYHELNNISIKLTDDIPLEDLLDIYESPDINIKKMYVKAAIGNIRDTSMIDDLIELYKSDLFVNSVLNSFQYMDNDKIIIFLGSIIEKSIKDNYSDYFYIRFPNIIANKSNDSLKIYYLKRCLFINEKYTKFRAAKFLAHLKDSTGIHILLNELDDLKNGNISEAIFALIDLDNKSAIEELIDKYYKIKNIDSILDYKKNNIIGYYLLGLNRLMDVETKKDLNIINYTHNIDQEMADIEITILEYLNNNNEE